LSLLPPICKDLALISNSADKKLLDFVELITHWALI
jgi:hypothetical protein